jgi:D-apiose dehydrogenase
MNRLRGICVGAGYFSQFHYDAWRRIEDVEIVAVCDRDLAKAEQAASRVGSAHRSAKSYTDLGIALREHNADFVDLITPPASHLALVAAAAPKVPAIICQKPLAPDIATAETLVAVATKANCRLMVHENFRFQPWHREIRRLIDQGAIGQRLHSITCRTRLGDGWGPDAYLSRQPYFRTMPRLLVHETGVHLIDTFRYLGGEITAVWADLRRLNDVIAGEDCGLLAFELEGGARALWDANRYNDSLSPDPRYTFGEFLIEGDQGSIRLDPDGRLTVQSLGQPEREHAYEHVEQVFGGDCVYATQRHFIDCLKTGEPFETGGQEYLQNLAIVEATYESARSGRRVPIRGKSTPAGRRIIDLSLPIDEHLPNAKVEPFKRLETDGWNATTITLYSHCGTHMDAPRHFLAGGAALEKTDLSVCCGPARVLDLTPIEPRELIGVERLRPWHDRIGAGDRLLLRTDWHRRFGTPDYRNALPRISPELATWLVERKVALLGVEPPSVADVNSLEELTVVHRILLGGGVTIVEGLAHLDQLQSAIVEFIALPLRIVGGDGCPVRAIAIEQDP